MAEHKSHFQGNEEAEIAAAVEALDKVKRAENAVGP
jgi:ribonuclease HI